MQSTYIKSTSKCRVVRKPQFQFNRQQQSGLTMEWAGIICLFLVDNLHLKTGSHHFCVVTPPCMCDHATELYYNARTGASFTGFWWRFLRQVALMKKVPAVFFVMTPKFAKSTDYSIPPTFHVTWFLWITTPGNFLPVGAAVEIRNSECTM